MERRPYTYGKVMAWSGLAIASRLFPKRRAALGEQCEKIRGEVLAAGAKMENGSRFFAATEDGMDVDASALLAFTSDFLPHDLARATRRRIEQKLGDGALVYRNEKQRKAGEGAFLLCSCWLVSHLIKEGELEHAEALLQEVLARLNPLGLFSEEIEIASSIACWFRCLTETIFLIARVKGKFATVRHRRQHARRMRYPGGEMPNDPAAW